MTLRPYREGGWAATSSAWRTVSASSPRRGAQPGVCCQRAGTPSRFPTSTTTGSPDRWRSEHGKGGWLPHFHSHPPGTEDVRTRFCKFRARSFNRDAGAIHQAMPASRCPSSSTRRYGVWSSAATSCSRHAFFATSETCRRVRWTVPSNTKDALLLMTRRYLS